MYPAQCCVQPAMYNSDYYSSAHFLSSPPKADDASAAGSTLRLMYGTSGAASLAHPGGAVILPGHEGAQHMATPTYTPAQQSFNPGSPAKQDTGVAGFDYKNVMVWLNQQACGGTTKRKRKINRKQRNAANQRERRRMIHLNVAFEKLRQRIPTFPHEKKLSRIQTLKFAIDYIALMTDILHDTDADNKPTNAQVSPRQREDSNGSGDHYWT